MDLVSFELKEKYLLVVGHGVRDSIVVMEKASNQILSKIVETTSRYVLVDYRKLIIDVKLGEAFNIVRHYEEVHPHLKNVVIAGVFNHHGAEFGKLWTEIGRKRGFIMEFFLDFESGEEWLLNQGTFP